MVAILTGFLLTHAHADVDAYVVHGTTGAAVADIEVAFLIISEAGTEEILRKRTNPDGVVRFSGPFLNQDISFVLVAFFKSVPYPTSRLQNGVQKQIVLEVFEPNGRLSDLRIGAHHLFIAVGRETVDVTQFITIENNGDGTYIGNSTSADRLVTEFRLPEGTFELQSLSGDLRRVTATRIFDMQPLPPGESHIAFSFRVDFAAIADGYRHYTLYPTERLEVYMFPVTINLPAPFADLGEVVIHERTYRHYRLDVPKVEEFIEIPVPVSKPTRWMLKWLAVTGAAVSGLIALVASRKSPKLATSIRPHWARIAGVSVTASHSELESLRTDLLGQLAALPENAEGSEHRHREALVRRVAAVYRLLDSEV